MIKIFGKELNLVEIFVGIFIEVPFYFLISLFVLPLCVISGFLWALGGAEKSSKLFRSLGVPLVTCLFLWRLDVKYLHVWFAFFPSVLWLRVGYGQDSWLFKLYMGIYDNQQEADFATRLTTYVVFWFIYAVTLKFCR